MSTKTEDASDVQNLQEGKESTKAGKPAYIDELKKNGSVMLTASTREDLFAQADTLKNAIKGGHLFAGAVGYNYDTCTYCLLINLVND